MSTDGLHYVVIHRHCNVHVTVLSAIKQLAQLLREARIVVQRVLVVEVPVLRLRP